MNGEVLSTADIATKFKTTAAAIRGFKQRHPDKLLEGTHWVTVQGNTAWTEDSLPIFSDLTGIPAPIERSHPEADAIASIESPEDLFPAEFWERLLEIAEQRTVPNLIEQGLKAATRVVLQRWLDDGTAEKKADDYALLLGCDAMRGAFRAATLASGISAPAIAASGQGD